MKASNGCIRLASKIWRWVVVILFLVCMGWMYSRYVSGSVSINMLYASEENLQLIVKNRDKLIEAGMFTLGYEVKEQGLQVLEYVDDKNNDKEIFFVLYTYRDKDSHHPTVYANYRRVGLDQALYGLGTFGECTTMICVDSGKCLIDARFYNADGNANVFDSLMKRIIEIVTA